MEPAQISESWRREIIWEAVTRMAYRLLDHGVHLMVTPGYCLGINDGMTGKQIIPPNSALTFHDLDEIVSILRAETRH